MLCHGILFLFRPNAVGLSLVSYRIYIHKNYTLVLKVLAPWNSCTCAWWKVSAFFSFLVDLVTNAVSNHSLWTKHTRRRTQF